MCNSASPEVLFSNPHQSGENKALSNYAAAARVPPLSLSLSSFFHLHTAAGIGPKCDIRPPPPTTQRSAGFSAPLCAGPLRRDYRARIRFGLYYRVTFFAQEIVSVWINPAKGGFKAGLVCTVCRRRSGGQKTEYMRPATLAGPF